MKVVDIWKRWFGLAPAPPPDTRRPRLDKLTELPSRAVMHDALTAALQSGTRGVVVMVDLDHFRYFNDHHGRSAGDELLRAVAGRLRETLAAASCLVRAGGDQFAAFLPGVALREAMRIAQACVDAMRVPMRLPGGGEIVTVSVGVATLAGQTDDGVWRACGQALQAAKARGRDRAVAYDDDTRRVAPSRHDLAAPTVELQTRLRALREEARTDALTGLRNRLALDELLRAATGDGDRRVQRAAVAVIAVDHFGDYGHAHGDAAADDALRCVAHAIKACAREADHVFHQGGEAFVLVLPGADDGAAKAAAERVRHAVEHMALPHPASAAAGVVTVTIGVASGPPGATLRHLLDAAAEQAMAAQVGGRRNRVHATRLADATAPPR